MTPLRARLFNPPNAVQEADGRPVARFVPKVVVPPPRSAQPAPRPVYVQPRPTKTWDFVLWSEDMDASPINMATIRDAVCATWDVTPEAIRARCRLAGLVVPKHVTYALCCHLTHNSLPMIGRFFGRDHTTILHAKQRMRPHYEAVALNRDATPIEWARAMKARLA